METPIPQLSTVPMWRRYLIGFALLAAALLSRLALTPLVQDRFPYTTVLIAVLLAAPYTGVGPSLIVAVGGLTAAYFGFSDHDPTRLGASIFLAVMVIGVVAQLRKTNDKARASALLADERLQQLRLETEQRTREERLSSQLRAVVESSEDAIVSKDLTGIIQSWNYGAEQIFGYTAAEAIGKSMSIVIPPDRSHEESDILERIRRGGRVKHFDTVRVRKDGRSIHVSLTISPIHDPAGQIVGISDIARDITERREFEEQLRQTQRLESLGVLAGGLAHDFNNLLTGILGNASLALEEARKPEERDRLVEILRTGERAALLIRQMLAYAGKGRFVMEKLDLSEQVNEIVGLLRTSIPKLVELELNLAPGLPPVEADRSQIQQVIMNLALNGAEAVGDRQGKVAITTSAREADDWQVVLEVRDNGCGMDEDTRARIFDPFFTTKFTGRGLGLAAVMGIIGAHKGTILVDTAPGEGSKFTVVLPAAEGAAAAAVELPERFEGDTFGHLLVVDDEELIRNMARFALERCGYTVQLASDGRSAVDAFAADPSAYSAVLLDLTMPVMSGEEALERMQQIRPGVRVVLSSGYTEVEALRKFQNHRLAGFLQKPYTATALARKIRQALRTR